MKRLILKPAGWPCTLAECPPGLFWVDGCLAIKTEYGLGDGRTEAYIAGSGEAFAGGGVSSSEEREGIEVIPLEWKLEEY